MKIKIPFHKNLKDDLHCFQACLKMVLSFFVPKKNFTYKKLDEITGHKKGKWTWDTMTKLWLAKHNFLVIKISNFDYRKFAILGEKYLKKFWVSTVYETQKQMSDLKYEQYLSKKILSSRNIKLIKRRAKVKDIEKYFNQEFMIVALINPYILKRQKDYSSHSVVITGINKKFVIFHESGLPAKKNKKAPLKLFNKALYDILAVKLRKN